MKAMATYRMLLICSAILVPGVTAQSAWAQTADEAAPETNEIIVTVERRAVSVQKAPLAIAVVSGELADARGVQTIETLALATPNLRFYETVQQGFITIRGVGGERNTTIGGDPSVALHIDGVYQARTNAANLAFFDIERIEVLRGPQGTLYGRNATGGSINIITKEAELGEASGSADFLLGNYSRRRARAVVNVPLGEKVALRVRGAWEDRDGFVRNLSFPDGSADLSDAGTRTVSGHLRVQFSDNVRLDLRADYEGVRAAGSSEEAVGAFGNPAYSFPPPLGFGALPEPEEPMVTRLDVKQVARTDGWGASAALAVDGLDIPLLGEAEWTTAAAYRQSDVFNISDADRTSARATFLNTTFDFAQKSLETRLVSRSDSAIQWQAGLFFIHEDNFGSPVLDSFLPSGNVASRSDIRMTVDAKSYAAFGQVTWSATDRLRLTAGGRFTRDTKESVQAFTITSPFLPAPVNVTIPGKRSWNALTGKIGAEFDFARSMLYVNATRGYKAGGFGLNQPAYDPEYIWAYEVGLKNRLFDGSVLLNLTGFHYQQQDLQVGIYTDGLLPGAPSVLVQNAARARTWGAEVELQATPVHGLQLTSALTYLDARFKSYRSVDPFDPIKTSVPGCASVPRDAPTVAIPPACLNEVDLSGGRQSLAPEFSASLGVEYTYETASVGSLAPRIDVTWTDRYLLRAFGKPQDQQSAYWNVDAVLRWTSPDGNLTADVFARNLFNVDVRAASAYLPFAQAIGVTFLPPRTLGGSIGVKF